MTIKRFEDLECWQVARILTKEIYDQTRLSEFSKDFKLTDQICSASVSIMNNISEGFDAQSNKEFIRFLTYSRRSCSEVQNCLYVSLDQGYITLAVFKHCYEQCARVRQIIDGLIRYLKHPRDSESNRENVRPTTAPSTKPRDKSAPQVDRPTSNGSTANGPTGTRANGPTGKRATG
ncbi:MAG: four helix bundle protein [Desulfobacteraceae bacterium]|nr:four helix bundle protein [Desulfobacteraceae bacterium]